MAGPQGAPRCQHRSGSATASPINDSTSSISTSSGRPGPGRSSASPGPGQPARPKRPRVIRRRTDGEVRAAISSTRSVSQFQLESSVALHRDCGCVSAWDHGNSPFQFDSSLAIHRDPERIGHPSPQAFQFDSSLAIHRDRCPDHVPEWVRVSIRFEFGDPSRRSGQWTCNACRVSIRFEFGDPSRRLLLRVAAGLAVCLSRARIVTWSRGAGRRGRAFGLVGEAARSIRRTEGRGDARAVRQE